MNKRGQGLPIGTLVLMILGIVILVFLVMGFTMGWSNLLAKINIFGGGGLSVNDVVNACKVAGISGDKFTICEKEWKIKVNGEEEKISCRNERVVPYLAEFEIDCNDVQLPPTEEERLLLGVGERDSFRGHQVSLKDVKEDEATFEIRSEVVTVTLSIGEEMLLDLDGDGEDDTLIRLIAIDFENKKVIFDIEEYSPCAEGYHSEDADEDGVYDVCVFDDGLDGDWTGKVDTVDGVRKGDPVRERNRMWIDGRTPLFGVEKEYVYGDLLYSSEEKGGLGFMGGPNGKWIDKEKGKSWRRQIIINPNGPNPCAGKPDFDSGVFDPNNPNYCRYFADENTMAEASSFVQGPFIFDSIEEGQQGICCKELCVIGGGGPYNCCGHPRPEKGTLCMDYVMSFAHTGSA
ncbi:MAG: hypothetical protein ABIG28_00420 [archaeon]